MLNYNNFIIGLEINSNPINENDIRTTIAKHINALGLKSKLKAKFVTTTDSNHFEPLAENILIADLTPRTTRLYMYLV